MTPVYGEWVYLIVNCFCFGIGIQLLALLGRRGQP